jgi:DNA-binding IclR family transcriptional regulator
MTTAQGGAATPRSDDETAPNYPIGSVDNALRLLLLFREHRSLRIADVSREIGVARSTAHRLVQMLVFHKLVVQDPNTRAYRAGPELIRLAVSVVRDIDLRAVGRPVLEQLVDELRETIHISILQGTETLFLDSIEPPRSVRVGSRTGMSLPAYATSTGKILLAGLDETRIPELYPTEVLRALTSRTLATRDDLIAELRRVRQQGYAENFGESEDEVCSIAVPIVDSTGRVRAALAMSAPPARIERTMVPDIAAVLAAGAEKIGNVIPI